jgi:hypothetical protein
MIGAGWCTLPVTCDIGRCFPFRHCYLHDQTDIVIWMNIHIAQVNSPPRRWPRHRLDVPLRVVVHTPDKTVIRDGRGRELGEGGMCFAAGVELKMGDQVEIEFTPAYSGHPIRVRAVARDGNGYSYGVEFVASSDQERHEIASLRENLQTLSSSYSPPSSQRAHAQEDDAPPRGPTEHAPALLNVSLGPTPECAPFTRGRPKSRRQISSLRSEGRKPRSIGKKPEQCPEAPRRELQLPDDDIEQ